MTKPRKHDKSETSDTPVDPRSGEPGAGSPAPDVWPFEVPPEQRERVAPEPARDERDGDVERAPQ